MALRTVRVPAEMSQVFEAAEHVVSRYFAERGDSPERGTIEVHGERYVLVRAAALSVEFFGLVRSLYGDGRTRDADELSRNLLFDLAHAIGKSDARSFHDKMKLSNPIERLSAGPVHFAHTGWANVDISPESRPTPDDNFYLLYDHPYSFEASAWAQDGSRAEFPVCVMNAGYSSGWCEESFGVTLLATEILCRARGDDCCRFVMAHPHKIEEHVAKYREARPDLHLGDFQIPDFFARKRIEEELRQSRDELEQRVVERTQELAEANSRLLQAQKLEAVGRLAGGIAHDFNNLLGMILMRTALLASKTSPDDPMARDLAEIQHACERGGALSRQLLAFSKRQPLEKRPMELGQLVGELARTMLPLLGEDVEVVTEVKREAHILGDKSQLEQVLMNLIVNARDAMPDGGTLGLAIDVVETEELRVTTGPLPRGRYAVLAVSDSGTGMDAETMARMFDPYFTTKPDGRGTGLGLSTVYGIVDAAGGGISVASVPGRGTTFKLYLPASTTPAATVRAPEPPRPSTATARILLVEDEPALRETLREVLSGTYDVVAAENGPAALVALDAATAPFDVVLTDLVMPKMSGRELGRRVRERFPAVKILYMSGYDREHFAEGADGPEEMLHKPFNVDELTERIDALVAKGRG